VAGGYYDQPPRTMYLMKIALNIYNALTEYDYQRKRGGSTEFTQWQKDNKSIIELIASLNKD